MIKMKLNLALAAALLLTGTAPAFGQDAKVSPKEQVDKLVAVLKSDADQKAKADACRELAFLGTAEAVAPLAALLTDAKLSHMARYGLETIPAPAVDTALRDALGKVKGPLLAGVIGSLGVRKDPQAVEPLAKLLTDDDAVIAQAAARALGKIATAAAIKALMDALPNVPAGNQVAFFEGAYRGAEALAARGERTEALALYDKLRALPGPQQDRVAALRGAILTRGAEGISLLRQSLRGEDYLLFAAAIRAAMEQPGSETAQALAAEVGQLPADKQIVVLQALAKSGDRVAVAPLLAAAKAGPKPVRIAAIRALAELSFQPLDDAATTGFGGAALALLDDPDREIAQVAQECVAALPNKMVSDDIAAMFKSDNTDKRLTAVDLIGRRRMTASIPVLLEAAGDKDAKVRRAALRKVGDLGSSADMPVLLTLLGRLKEAGDLDAVEQALSDLCAKSPNADATAEALIDQLAQAQGAQKCAMLRLLSGAGGAKALKTVRAAVDDPNPDVHATAIRALGTWKTADAAPELLALARSAAKPSDKVLCLRGYLDLASQSEQTPAQCLAMCRQAVDLAQSTDEKKMLLSTLSGIRSADALPLITPYLETAAVKEEAGAAVVAVAERLLRGQNAARIVPKVTGPLEKVAAVTGNAELAKRAKAALATAKTKAAAK